MQILWKFHWIFIYFYFQSCVSDDEDQVGCFLPKRKTKWKYSLLFIFDHFVQDIHSKLNVFSFLINCGSVYNLYLTG